MQKKENQRVVLTRRLLYEALLEILKKKHISQVTVTELCTAAGINRATFYAHYNMPNDILIWVFEKHADAMHDIQVRQQAGEITMEQLVVENCEYLYDNREFFKVLISNGIDEALGSRVLDDVFRRAALPTVLNSENLDATDRQLILTCIISGCYSLVSKWLMDDLPKTPRELAALVIKIFSHGWI